MGSAADKHSASNLLELPPKAIDDWLNSFDTVISDCDGVIWILGKNVEGSIETLNRLKENGKKIYYCTNNSTESRSALTQKARKMGLTLMEEDMLCTAYETAAQLKRLNFNKRAYIVGSEGLVKELDAVGIQHTNIGPDVLMDPLHIYINDKLKLEKNIGAVIVGRDEHFSYPKLIKAASYLKDPDCLLIATNVDAQFPMGDKIYPGTGPLVAAIETAADRTARLIGKPNVDICLPLIDDGIIDPSRTLMIGDNMNTDILLGYNCGFQTLLVGTGVHSLNDVELMKQSNDIEAQKKLPDYYVPRLGDLLKFL